MYYDKKKENGYKSFTKDLKEGDPGSVVLLYGEERFLTDWAEKEIRKKYKSIWILRETLQRP
jgi:DNA polymerase III delta subunit